MSKYRLRYFFDYGGPCLWAANDTARDRFDYSIDLAELPLSPETIQTAKEIGAWFDQSLNWDYPPDPGPWRQDECDRFNRATADLLNRIRQELGSEFEVVNEQNLLAEDPDLDAYLADPKDFRRRSC
jgi:hypothetical protein